MRNAIWKNTAFPILWMPVILVTAMAFSPLSPWMDAVPDFDSQVFLTCSKLINEGWVMYRDIFDHKGPFIYLYDLAGWKLGGTWGVWLLALFFHGISWYYYDRMAYRITRSRQTAHLTSLFVILMQIQLGEDNTVELVCMPFLTYTVSVLIHHIRNGRALKKQKAVAMAACLAVVLLVKPNFAACAVFPALCLLIRTAWQRDWKLVGAYLLYLTAGMALVMIPVWGYLAANGALKDFIDTYLIFNFRYSSVVSLPMRAESFFRLAVLTPMSMLTCFFGAGAILQLIRKKEYPKVLFLSGWMLFTAILNLGLSGFAYRHYIVPVIPVSCVFIALFWKNAGERLRIAGWLCMLGCLLVFGRGCWLNVKILCAPERNNEMYHVAETIKEHSGPEDRIALYEAPPYLYVLSQRKPVTRYIYQYPPFSMKEELRKEFLEDIYRNRPQMLVMAPEQEKEFTKSFRNEYQRIHLPESGFLIFKRKK